MRIPMRDKQPNRPKSLRLKISFFVLQLILGNKNRVIRRKILASLYNLGYRSRTLQVLFPALIPWNTTVSGLFSCLCPCGFSPEENMILQMILGGESYVQNQVQTGRRNKSHNVSALARHGEHFWIIKRLHRSGDASVGLSQLSYESSLLCKATKCAGFITPGNQLLQLIIIFSILNFSLIFGNSSFSQGY